MNTKSDESLEAVYIYIYIYIYILYLQNIRIGGKTGERAVI